MFYYDAQRRRLQAITIIACLVGVPSTSAAQARDPEAVFAPLWRTIDRSDGRTKMENMPYALHLEANSKAPESGWTAEMRRKAIGEISKHPRLAATMPYSRVSCAGRVCEIVFATTSQRYLEKAESDEAYHLAQQVVIPVSSNMDGEFSISRTRSVQGSPSNGLLIYIYKSEA